jgi:hypothetical protein
LPRLKSLTAHPPYSFRHLQPELGQTEETVGSFNAVVEQVQMMRLANPFMCERYGWRTDTAGVEADVHNYNVARCVNNGWWDFLLMDEPGVAAPFVAPAEKKSRLPGAVGVGSVKRVAAGIALLVDWLGSGAKGVESALAEKRAMVCSTCPKNDGGDFTSYFTEPIAEKIRVQLEMKNDLQLRTSYDDKLTVCSACSCPIKLKVHVEISYILAHMSDEVKKQLHPACWITAEELAAS